jgi:hypothetical protein
MFRIYSSQPLGKSSQAQRVAAQLGLQHLSSGDLLRECKASATPLGRYMRENWFLLPPPQMLPLLACFFYVAAPVTALYAC